MANFLGQADDFKDVKILGKVGKGIQFIIPTGLEASQRRLFVVEPKLGEKFMEFSFPPFDAEKTMFYFHLPLNLNNDDTQKFYGYVNDGREEGTILQVFVGPAIHYMRVPNPFGIEMPKEEEQKDEKTVYVEIPSNVTEPEPKS